MCASAYDADVGGMQLPWMADQALNGMFVCANNPAHIYLFLTQGVANMLNVCGSDELKAKYLPNLVDGKWFGTMCLSETQAGSSLADIRTKAEPKPDGSYALSGTKMWISGGEQDITENIVHMVLAKIPGSPPGVKGISLFLVPKNRVNDDGTIGASNNVALAGLNHKMGCRGATNCLLNFGESGESIGYLVGEPNQGSIQYVPYDERSPCFCGHVSGYECPGWLLILSGLCAKSTSGPSLGQSQSRRSTDYDQ